MICEFFCLNADFATKAQVNMVSLDLSMAAAQLVIPKVCGGSGVLDSGIS